MRILVTGAKGFVGKNLVCALNNVKNGYDKTRNVSIEEVYEFDIDTDELLLDEYCKKADFVFNLAGINRPLDESEFKKGNTDFARKLLENLEKYDNNCPVMLSSSIQASLSGRYKDSEYGISKKHGEEEFFSHGEKTNSKVLVYRFPNLFGKWCRPNYNSVVATFCNAFANDLPYSVSDENIKLNLVYIDDLVDEMILALKGEEHKCDYNETTPVINENGKYCFVPISHEVTLGRIVELLKSYKAQSSTLIIPEMENNSFEKKLYSTYLSYLPKEKISIPLTMNTDVRGSFTEILKTEKCGQFSVNIIKPGQTKGEHWHNTKWELFVVVSGKAIIQERKIGSTEIIEFNVSGDKMETIHMLPGYTHNIINNSDSDVVCLMWANELLDKNHPDTFSQKV